MARTPELPTFALAEWYRYPRDHRCPHDSWLEALEISEPAIGERKEMRNSAVTLRLLGAYHDGYIIFRYSGVQSYSVVADSSAAGIGDWLTDEFSLVEDGWIEHRIHWSGQGPKREAVWAFKAREITYEWVPKS